MLKRFHSLQAALFFHELSFVLLVVITATVGIVWSVSWQQSSVESLRISSMNTSVQNIRGELYRQLKEVFDASFLYDYDAVEEYQAYTVTIKNELEALNSLALDLPEKQAIGAVSAAYIAFYDETVVLFREDISQSAQKQLLENQLEQHTFAQLESAFSSLEGLLKNKQQSLTQSRSRWSHRLMWLAPIPFLLAIALLLAARRFVKQNVVSPLTDVIRGAKLISTGDLEHAVPTLGVTELARLSEAINTMAQELTANRDRLVETKKQAAMGELVPLVAHNIRNPLAGIRAASQVARDDDIPIPVKDTLTDIIVAVDRLEHWVTSLLSFLHPMKPHFSETTLIDVADNALSLIELQLVDKNIEINRVGWDCEAKILKLDLHLFEQALFNLIQNALEASSEGDIITLSYQENVDSISLKILDQGKGMTFDPISEQVLDGEIKRLGCGLGIPFAQKIIKQHAGQLTYHSGKKCGTEVEINLMLESK